MLVTSGAVTKRIDRLGRQQLVTRRTAVADGRRRVVALTAAGVALVDELITRHLANEARILSSLTPDQRRQLGDLLGLLAVTLEPQTARPSS